jgi:FkbM family methyltransferase
MTLDDTKGEAETDLPRWQRHEDGKWSVLLWHLGMTRDDAEFHSQSGWQPRNLRRPEFDPATLVDVGVASGTHNLYFAYPNAYRVLIEPLEEFEGDLRGLTEKAKSGGEYHIMALGAESKEIEMYVDHDMMEASSILASDWRAPPPDRRVIPMTTLDELLEQQGWTPPFGLKIDTEGFEYDVVRGAEKFLRDTQFVIAEVNVSKRFDGSYTFAQFIQVMSENGFRLRDILDGAKAGDREILYIDALFSRGE